MTIDVYSSTGTKSGSVELPPALFEAPVNTGLMHLAVVRQQSNRRNPIAHVKTRGEIIGSTKKLFQQKGTGRARRGPIRSPLLKGGGKTFGPRNNANFTKDMPKKMRRAALFSCLSVCAKQGSIIGLENYPDDTRTKTLFALLKKLPVELGRKILIVLPAHHKGLELSARNLPRVKTLLAPYLNAEDLLMAKKVIFLVDAIKVAEETFTEKNQESRIKNQDEENTKSEEPNPKKASKKVQSPKSKVPNPNPKSQTQKPPMVKKSSPAA